MLEKWEQVCEHKPGTDEDGPLQFAPYGALNVARRLYMLMLLGNAVHGGAVG